MEVKIQSLVHGARRARGSVILIDVFTSATLAATILANGARRIVPARSGAEARALRREEPSALLIGEWMGKQLPGFDHNTNALASSSLDVAGRTVVLATTNGTRGILAAAANADALYLGCFRNARAVAECVRGQELVTLVPIGIASGRVRAIEDELCAELLRALLLEEATDFEAIRRRVRRDLSSWIRNIGRGSDVAFCLELDSVDVVPRLERGALVP